MYVSVYFGWTDAGGKKTKCIHAGARLVSRTQVPERQAVHSHAATGQNARKRSGGLLNDAFFEIQMCLQDACV